MDILAAEEPCSQTACHYDRAKELQASDETRAGVKGLVDAEIAKIPRIFIRPPDELVEELNCQQNNFQVPVIDLDGIKDSKHDEIVDQVRSASEKWGFFQVVNHGIPLNVLEEMIGGIRSFNEQDLEVKKEWYTRDEMRKVRFNSNFDLYQSRTANWRDSLTFTMSASNNLEPEELPTACRDRTMEYIKHARKLEETLFELLSEALGLKPDYLQAKECAGECTIVCHYYPPCPEPELTIGYSSHSDPSFLTILLQDQIGDLQGFHENQWADVHPIAGGLVVNIGDYLRVVAKRVGPRLSVACFFTGNGRVAPKSYGPIKELITEENPPLYRSFLVSEYFGKYFARGLDGKTTLDQYKLI